MDPTLNAPVGLDLGIVEFEGASAVIQMPPTARVGEEVLITIRTSGLGGRS